MSRQFLWFRRSVWFFALLASAASAQAQVSAAISGKVEDASGAAVQGAMVTVTSLETGASRSVTTGANGNYAALALPLGPQEIKAEKEGFKAAVRTGINLEVGQQAVVNLRLVVGEFVQQVSVSEETPVVNTTTAPVAGFVSGTEIRDLPLNGRSFDNLITLNPGTINYTLKSPQTITSNGNTFSVAGRRTSENLFLLNGVEYTGSSQLAITPGGPSGELLGVDAIREFNVLTDTYSAQYGKRAGAQVSVVTQSGTNALHGSLFEFLRNSDLDARNFYDQDFVPPFRRNQFGGSLGGPIQKNKLFLFGNYEGFRQSLAESSLSVVPDAQMRQGLLPNASGVYTPVPNLNRAMLGYMSYWPEPNGPELLSGGLPSGTALSFNNPSQRIHEDFGTVRADYKIGSRDSASAAYTIDNGHSTTPQADPLFGSALVLQNQVASVEETHVFSPEILNTFRAGFSRAAFNFDPVEFFSFDPNLSFLAGAAPGGIVIGGGVTTSVAGTVTSAGPNNAANAWNRRNLFTYTDDVQIVKGIHQIGFGVWFQPLQDNEDTGSRQLGQATFSTLKSFLQGTASNFQAIPNPTELGFRSLLGAFYFKDTMKLRPNLTVDAGLRYEFTTGWNEVAGRAANYITGPDGVLLTDPIVGDSLFTKNNATHLLGPRIGLAWDPFGNGKTAVRAGFGTYYSLIDDLSFLVNSLPPFNGAITFSNEPLSSFTPVLPSVPQPPSCGPGVPKPCTIFAPQGVQADAKTPTVEEWNLTLERELSPNTVLRASYVGSFGYHGFLSIDPNTIPAQICSNAAGCLAGGTGSAKSTVPEGAQYIPVGSRPNPYLAAGFFWYTEGNTSYNSLQLDVTHRLSRDLQFRANYTWSKNLDMNSGLTIAQANNQPQMVMDRLDPGRDWGPSALDVTSQASVSARYDLPVGRGKRWLGGASGFENKLAGGWQLNGIGTFLSGFPFTPLIGTNRSGDGDTRNPDRPNLNPSFSGPVILHNPNRWFDPNAFSMPAPGTYGDLGRGVYRGPGLSDLDLSVLKRTSISERMNLEFRAEFFNILNQANFGTPKSTVFSSGKPSASAGLITSTTTSSRQIQFGLKLIF